MYELFVPGIFRWFHSVSVHRFHSTLDSSQGHWTHSRLDSRFTVPSRRLRTRLLVNSCDTSKKHSKARKLACAVQPIICDNFRKEGPSGTTWNTTTGTYIIDIRVSYAGTQKQQQLRTDSTQTGVAFQSRKETRVRAIRRSTLQKTASTLDSNT